MISWFEIPVTDMQRAKSFYEKVFEIEISVHDLDGFVMGGFPFGGDKPGASGSLVQHQMYRPSETDGTLVYFWSKDVQNELDRVEAAGGIIQRPKTAIGGEHGFMAVVIDSEGNRIALHSSK